MNSSEHIAEETTLRQFRRARLDLIELADEASFDSEKLEYLLALLPHKDESSNPRTYDDEEETIENIEREEHSDDSVLNAPYEMSNLSASRTRVQSQGSHSHSPVMRVPQFIQPSPQTAQMLLRNRLSSNRSQERTPVAAVSSDSASSEATSSESTTTVDENPTNKLPPTFVLLTDSNSDKTSVSSKRSRAEYEESQEPMSVDEHEPSSKRAVIELRQFSSSAEKIRNSSSSYESIPNHDSSIEFIQNNSSNSIEMHSDSHEPAIPRLEAIHPFYRTLEWLSSIEDHDSQELSNEQLSNEIYHSLPDWFSQIRLLDEEDDNPIETMEIDQKLSPIRRAINYVPINDKPKPGFDQLQSKPTVSWPTQRDEWPELIEKSWDFPPTQHSSPKISPFSSPKVARHRRNLTAKRLNFDLYL